MGDESIFVGTIQACEFYADESLPVRADYDNHCIHVGRYIIDWSGADEC